MFGQQYWFTDSRGRNHGVSSLETNHFVDPDVIPKFGEATEWDMLEPTCFSEFSSLKWLDGSERCRIYDIRNEIIVCVGAINHG
jgi:hypothetical protein